MTDTANTPERIWMTAEDHGASWHGAFRAFRCSNLDHSNDDGPNPDYPEYVLTTHCDELVAAAYMDAAQVLEDEIDLARIALPQAVPVLRSDIKAIKNRTPTKAMSALTAYGERMKAEGAREAQAKIARLTMIANELSWSKKTRDISNRLFAALQENANE